MTPPLNLEESSAFRLAEGQALKDRLIQLERIATAFYPEELAEIFLSETRDQENRQVIQSVWFFTQGLVAEFKNPMGELNFDATRISDTQFVALQVNEFDVLDGTFSDSSRVTAYLYFSSDIAGTLQASRENCRELIRILRVRVLPRLR